MQIIGADCQKVSQLAARIAARPAGFAKAVDRIVLRDAAVDIMLRSATNATETAEGVGHQSEPTTLTVTWKQAQARRRRNIIQLPRRAA